MRYDRNDPWQPLAELWELVLANPVHSPFCSCLVPMGISIDATTLEQDLLDYLLPRYQAQGRERLAGALAGRAATARTGFIDWLRNIGHDLPEPDTQRLIEDITKTLSTFQDAAPTNRFACT